MSAFDAARIQHVPMHAGRTRAIADRGFGNMIWVPGKADRRHRRLWVRLRSDRMDALMQRRTVAIGQQQPVIDLT